MIRQITTLSLLFIMAGPMAWPAAIAQPTTLQGRVEQEDFRIRRKNTAPQQATADTASELPPVAPPLAGRASQTGLTGLASQDAQKSLVPTSDFAQGPKNFDIGAEAQSKEMVLAWERWHKQLAAAIYELWERRAKTPGKATVRITVYKNRILTPEIMSVRGGPEFRATLSSVFNDLNGNPGLTFPAKSQRQKVSFEAEYIAGSDVDPGYSWLKNDYETVREQSIK